MKNQFFISCPRYLEPTLVNEFKEWGFFDRHELDESTEDRVKEVNGGVYFNGNFEEAFHVIFNSRIASRVFLLVDSFPIDEAKNIYEMAIKKIKWDDYFQIDQTFKINTLIDQKLYKENPQQLNLKNSVYFSQLLKDGIVDYFRNKFNSRPSVNLKNADASFLMHLEMKEGAKARDNKTFVNIFIDLTGMPLSNRGYRTMTGPAPLRENLAAGLFLNSHIEDLYEKFDNKDRKSKPYIIDSMCGTGTFLIEALLCVLNMPPSYLKVMHYTSNNKVWDIVAHAYFTKSPKLQKQFFNKMEETKKIAQKILKQSSSDLPYIFLGFDQDRKSLEIADANINRAHLSPFIKLKREDALKLIPPHESIGLIFCNPPYGKRLKANDTVADFSLEEIEKNQEEIKIQTEELEKLYHEYGEQLKRQFKHYRALVFTGNSEMRKKISLKTSAKIPFFNGDIESRLLIYDLY
ncbi:MAG: hypothetical protein U0T83_07950 [Bacteriovoracaceae bacterium]